MRVLSELKKLLQVKAIWIIYLLLIIAVIVKMTDPEPPERNLFSEAFYVNHGDGPYDLNLIIEYHKLVGEMFDKCGGFSIDENRCDVSLSERSKEIRNLYPNFSYEELLMATMYMFGGSYSETDKIYDLEFIDQEIDKQKQLDKNDLEAFFFSRMLDYHENNPRIKEINQGEVYFLLAFERYDLKESFVICGIIAVFMMIFGIGSSNSFDLNANVDYIILSSKTGRHILKYKLLSSILFSLLVSMLCFIPLLLVDIISNKWYLYFNSKLIFYQSSNYLMNLMWYDFNLIQFLLFAFLLAIITNIFISIIIFIISILSKKFVNCISYNIVFIALAICTTTFISTRLVITQIIEILINLNPYVFLFKNINMYDYSIYSSVSYLTYKEFPVVYILVNSCLLAILYYLTTHYYKKMNL